MTTYHLCIETITKIPVYRTLIHFSNLLINHCSPNPLFIDLLIIRTLLIIWNQSPNLGNKSLKSNLLPSTLSVAAGNILKTSEN